ncbi:Helix-turn-helix domain-containing protein [Streptoalloteichus tenebrarius]|uniref:Helix-turn-helix domain-containing protein n=1 Tax=Streptoalloteichus tenebrarius (strain ATCC 17920 / DSM 40477 / JCM 4838 / CBS 697.72 / NBRC 16177 / NCIMB 11028 / NRRL B-12390 / A12253. 1 / ISP 5477) TaxID=1933 RepID=A0ABT1HNQ8_STRSD|nr:winged helix-turn-helix domain-containing protein [Streptoalloteichus tenebrarius]MCP2257120.1 Helix-turn-helix domain-containing protein [Streptoalloteichus tenebrarius]BFE98752.1 winged helix-turn-helix domain-containing protein [Streptoalloteichus tenebrarius]
MTLLRLSPTALSRCRFAVSPLAETIGALITLHRPGPDPWHQPWHGDNQSEYRTWLARDPVAAGLLGLVAATKRFPDLVALPPKDGMRTRLADELAEVAAHSDEHVRATVAESVTASWEPQDTAWLELDGLGSRVAAVLAEGFHRFVAPDWARRRAVLERDIMYRAGLLAAYGWQHAVETMRNRSVWVGENAIRFSDQDWPDRHIDAEGLIFVPRTTAGGWWTCERPPRYALVYPARGVAAPAAAPRADPLATLLGGGRARVLRELARPATSTQLAHALGVSLGTVSAHLAVLREADAATRTRAGRNVVYLLTERGERLVALLEAEPAEHG